MSTCHLLALKSIDWLGIPRDGGAAEQAGDQGQMFSIVMFAVSIVLTLWLFSRIQGRIHSPSVPYRPYRMFNRLLRHHGLRRKDRWMLLLLAGCQGMRQPTMLLLSPAVFTRQAEEWLARSSIGSRWPGARQRLVHIAQQVFTAAGSVGGE